MFNLHHLIRHGRIIFEDACQKNHFTMGIVKPESFTAWFVIRHLEECASLWLVVNRVNLNDLVILIRLFLTSGTNPQTMQRLTTNLDANRDKFHSWLTIKRLNVGVTDENAERSLHVDDHNLGACSTARPSAPNEGYEDVALVSFLSKVEDSLLPDLIII